MMVLGEDGALVPRGRLLVVELWISTCRSSPWISKVPEMYDAAPRSPEAEPPARLTLAGCLDILGPIVLRPLVAPRGVDIPIAEVVIAGAGDPVPPTDSGLLLLAGTHPGSVSALRMLERAQGMGYAAVVLRADGTDAVDVLLPEAERLGVALLETPAETPWRHLSDLITAAVSIGSVTDADVGGEAADLFGLANSIAGSVGGAITIEDPQGRVLAYSSLPDQAVDQRRRESILGRRSPDRPENAEEFRRVIRARGRAVRFDFDDPVIEASRIAVAVQAGNEAVAVIFAIDLDPPLGPEAPARLEEAARLTALHVLRGRAQQNPQRWAQAEALRSLLDSVGSPDNVVERLGEVVRRACVVVAVGAVHRAPAVPLTMTRVPEVVAVQARAWHESSVTTTIGSTVYALVPVTVQSAGTGTVLRRFAEEMVGSVRRSTGETVRVAFGPIADLVDDVLLSRRVADRVLAAMDGTERTVAMVEDVRSRVVLREIAERDHFMLEYYGGPVDQVLEHDRDHGTDYGATLLAYLEAFGKTDVAARQLVVHENTMRYRIRRLDEMFGLTLEDPDDRLLAWLQLRVLLRDGPRRAEHVARDKPDAGS